MNIDHRTVAAGADRDNSPTANGTFALHDPWRNRRPRADSAIPRFRVHRLSFSRPLRRDVPGNFVRSNLGSISMVDRLQMLDNVSPVFSPTFRNRSNSSVENLTFNCRINFAMLDSLVSG
jgi:hypothetical protein